MAKRHQKW